MESVNLDIPFEHRFSCWFCGEGSHQTVVATLATPPTPQQHSLVNMPICDECKSYRCHLEVKSIASLKIQIKSKIVKRSAKALAVGVNWTEEELKNSELNGSAFDGFIKSAWPMYLIAKERLNYSGWPLSIDGIPVDYLDHFNVDESTEALLLEQTFVFDGLIFTSFICMLDYLSDTFSLNRTFLKQVLTIYGHHRAVAAVKFCRLIPQYAKLEREQALYDLIESVRENQRLK